MKVGGANGVARHVLASPSFQDGVYSPRIGSKPIDDRDFHPFTWRVFQRHVRSIRRGFAWMASVGDRRTA
jgi:hypothetical protein